MVCVLFTRGANLQVDEAHFCYGPFGSVSVSLLNIFLTMDGGRLVSQWYSAVVVVVTVKSKVKVEIRETNDDAILPTCSSQTVRRGRKSV